MIQTVTKELEASLLILSLKKSEKSEIIIGYYYNLLIYTRRSDKNIKNSLEDILLMTKNSLTPYH